MARKTLAWCQSLRQKCKPIFFPDLFLAPFQAPVNPKFTFIDLFAGIGGFRMAFQNLGGVCVCSSEWDEQAKKTYYANYGDVPFKCCNNLIAA